MIDEIKKQIYSKDLRPGSRILALVSREIWNAFLQEEGFVQSLHNSGTWDLEGNLRVLIYFVNGINGVKLGVEF